MGSDLSIMIAKGLGKVRRFKASSAVVVGGGVFFAGFIISSVFFINAYFTQLRENSDLRKHVATLERREKATHEKIYRMREKTALLKEYIRLMKKPSGKLLERIARTNETRAEEKSAVPAVPVKTVKSPEKEPKPVTAESESSPVPQEQAGKDEAASQEAAPKTTDPRVLIDGLKVARKNTSLNVSFKLMKTAQDSLPLRGYVHMIVMDGNVSPPQARTFPHEVLKDGIPVDHKRGQLFIIKHFKVLRGRFFLSGLKHVPDSIRIFVYDKDGALLLDRELPMKAAG
jgi:hypothetical protein